MTTPDKPMFTLEQVMQIEYEHENNVGTHPIWPLARQLADTMRENERLREALEAISGMSVNQHVGNNLREAMDVASEALKSNEHRDNAGGDMGEGPAGNPASTGTPSKHSEEKPK